MGSSDGDKKKFIGYFSQRFKIGHNWNISLFCLIYNFRVIRKPRVTIDVTGGKGKLQRVKAKRNLNALGPKSVQRFRAFVVFRSGNIFSQREKKPSQSRNTDTADADKMYVA